MHVIAAKAVAFKEALSRDLKATKKVIENARVMADDLSRRGLRIVSGNKLSYVLGRFEVNIHNRKS